MRPCEYPETAIVILTTFNEDDLMMRGLPAGERELEVLQSAACGERNKEIAYKLGITERTVKAHLANIY